MSLKALVVDNSASVLRIMEKILKKRNYDVITAKDGLLALQELESFRPDIIFIDLIMPNISGDKLCRIIRNRPGFESVFITIISAIAAEQKIDFLSFGADACVAKGTLHDFEKNIATVLAHSEQKELLPFSEDVLGLQNIYERDITRELLATKSHYEITLENMLDSFIEVNLAGMIIFANRAASKLLGARNEDIVSSSFFNYFTDSGTADYLRTAFRSLSESPVEIGETFPIPFQDKFLLIKFIPVCDGLNKNIIITINDITRRKKAEDDLQLQILRMEDIVRQKTTAYEEANESLQEEICARKIIEKKLKRSVLQWKKTFDTINDCVSIHDQNFRLIMVNSSLLKLLGKKESDILGRRCYEVIHNTKTPWPDCPHSLALADNKTVTREITDVAMGKTLLVTCTPYMDNTGTITGTVHIARDITEQKQFEREREQLITELQRALQEIKTLKGILPLCSFCKRIRNEAGKWVEVDHYIHQHSEADISHSICHECAKIHYPQDYKAMYPEKK